MLSKSLQSEEKEHETLMQTLTQMDKVIIEDYYHMTTMNEDMNWMEQTHPLSNVSLSIRAPFCTSNFTSKTSIPF